MEESSTVDRAGDAQLADSPSMKDVSIVDVDIGGSVAEDALVAAAMRLSLETLEEELAAQTCSRRLRRHGRLALGRPGERLLQRRGAMTGVEALDLPAAFSGLGFGSEAVSSGRALSSAALPTDPRMNGLLCLKRRTYCPVGVLCPRGAAVRRVCTSQRTVGGRACLAQLRRRRVRRMLLGVNRLSRLQWMSLIGVRSRRV